VRESEAVGERSVVLPEPRKADLEVDDVVQVRHLLEDAGVSPEGHKKS
jgi:hypothetical protein